MNHILYYNRPLTTWNEALPVGGGNSGAMVFTGTAALRLQLNEITLWNDESSPGADREGAHRFLPELRKLINEHRYEEAQALTDAEFTCGNGDFDSGYRCSYQTFGDLTISARGLAGEKEKNIRTVLDLTSSVLTDSVTYKENTLTREIFVSHPANMIFLRLKSEKPETLTLRYERQDVDSMTVLPGLIDFSGYCDGDENHMHFAGKIAVMSTDGSLKAGAGCMIVEGPTQTVIGIALATDYICDASLDFKSGDPVRKTAETLKKAETVGFDEHKTAACDDYSRLYSACVLEPECADRDHIPTDVRLTENMKGKTDVGLSVLLFNYGRYLLISCSREDNILPANLQGLWCDDYEAPWHCDYHMNINVQMNYWPAGPAGLADCTDPFARLICALPENGRKTARAYYDARGWTAYTITNPRLWTSPGWGGGWSQYPLGGAWLCRHLIEYYNYTGDTRLLKEFYPVIRENVLFNLDILYKREDGKYITNPATSPENNFRDELGRVGWISRGTTMDIEMLTDNFTDFIRVSSVLGLDEEMRDEVSAALENLAPLKIGSAGQLCEWENDWDLNAPEIHHRHVSHLYGLHPGNSISVEKTPALAQACRKSLELRGDAATGWSLAWKINFFARLGDGEHAYSLINRLLCPMFVSDRPAKYAEGGGVYSNLLDAHPPFQIDGNFGATAGICEMLLQSHDTTQDGGYLIRILPALPQAWKNGTVHGLVARGNVRIGIKWTDGQADAISVLAAFSGPVHVKGEYSCIGAKERHENGVTVFDAQAGVTYMLLPSGKTFF